MVRKYGYNLLDDIQTDNNKYSLSYFSHLDKTNSLPDWQYRIEWCKRRPAKSLPWQRSSRKIKPPPSLWRKSIAILIDWIWRNRWLQEGSEVIGRNNLSLVKLQWLTTKAVIQETYWHPPWNKTGTVKSRYEISLEPDELPPLPKIK